MVVQVWEPGTCTPATFTTPEVCTEGAYVAMTLETLLGDLVTFEDSLTRYVALKAFAAGVFTPPMFSATEMQDGTAAVGQLDGVAFPAFPSGGAAAAWMAVAVPSSVGLAYVTNGQSNGGNRLFSWVQQAGTIDVDVAGDGTLIEYDVWVHSNPLIPLVLGAGWYIFFDLEATVP